MEERFELHSGLDRTYGSMSGCNTAASDSADDQLSLDRHLVQVTFLCFFLVLKHQKCCAQ